ncbi:MAG: hypothetical protein ACK5QX_12170 [bacterium]
MGVDEGDDDLRVHKPPARHDGARGTVCAPFKGQWQRKMPRRRARCRRGAVHHFGAEPVPWAQPLVDGGCERSADRAGWMPQHIDLGNLDAGVGHQESP